MTKIMNFNTPCLCGHPSASNFLFCFGVCMCLCMHVHAHTYTCLLVCMRVCMCVHACTCSHLIVSLIPQPPDHQPSTSISIHAVFTHFTLLEASVDFMVCYCHHLSTLDSLIHQSFHHNLLFKFGPWIKPSFYFLWVFSWMTRIIKDTGGWFLHKLRFTILRGTRPHPSYSYCSLVYIHS